jgi:hypothetical protein
MPPADRRRRQQQPEEQSQNPVPQMPRALKYAWGVGMTALLASSLLLDRGSDWMPLINRAIDLLQQQTAPSESR